MSTTATNNEKKSLHLSDLDKLEKVAEAFGEKYYRKKKMLSAFGKRFIANSEGEIYRIEQKVRTSGGFIEYKVIGESDEED